MANFLIQLFKEGYQYRSLNVYRSAIGLNNQKIDKVRVGNHPLITCILKGSKHVWNINRVLACSVILSESLSLRGLTIKTTVLLELTRPIYIYYAYTVTFYHPPMCTNFDSVFPCFSA